MQTQIITLVFLNFLSVLVSTECIGQDYGKFEGALKLEDAAAEYVNTGPNDPGHTEFKLIEDYTYVDKDGQRWTAPSGTVVNGASIPRVAWSIIGGPWDGEYRNAAVIHDFMCDNEIESSDFTHRVFFEAMMASNVSDSLAKLMYYAVRKGGPQWVKQPGFLPPIVTRGNLTVEELRLFSEVEKMEDLTLDQIDSIVEKTSQ